VLSIEELRAVLRAANALTLKRRVFISLLILLGQRRGETARLRWCDLHLDQPGACWWQIPADHTKTKTSQWVPLCSQVCGLLALLPRTDTEVFAPSKVLAQSSGLRRQLDTALATMAAPMQGRFCFHDFRRSLASGLADNFGTAPHLIEIVLNHATGPNRGSRTTSVYLRSTYRNQIKTALEQWADLLTGVASKPTATNINEEIPPCTD
jgi:integrase